MESFMFNIAAVKWKKHFCVHLFELVHLKQKLFPFIIKHPRFYSSLLLLEMGIDVTKIYLNSLKSFSMSLISISYRDLRHLDLSFVKIETILMKNTAWSWTLIFFNLSMKLFSDLKFVAQHISYLILTKPIIYSNDSVLFSENNIWIFRSLNNFHSL